MSVATHTTPDSTTQTGTQYKGALDAASSVNSQLASQFAPQQNVSALSMSVQVRPGRLLVSGALVQQAVNQTSGTITAPASNPRRDLICINATTGAISIATGTEAASPTDPAVPAGTIPVGRINLTVGMTQITNNDIDDLRPFNM